MMYFSVFKIYWHVLKKIFSQEFNLISFESKIHTFDYLSTLYIFKLNSIWKLSWKFVFIIHIYILGSRKYLIVCDLLELFTSSNLFNKFNPHLTKGGGYHPLEIFSCRPKNPEKVAYKCHLLNYILFGHFDGKKSGVPPSGEVKWAV